jgi:hypothetical protein
MQFNVVLRKTNRSLIDNEEQESNFRHSVDLDLTKLPSGMDSKPSIDDVLFEAVRGFFTSIFEVFPSVNDFKNTGLFLEVTRSGVDLALVLLTRTRGVTSPSFFGILADSFLWTGLLPACSTELEHLLSRVHLFEFHQSQFYYFFSMVSRAFLNCI